MFTEVYGLVSASNREGFWTELKGLKERWVGPWVVEEDFNVIRFVNEKSSGERVTHSI